MSRWIKKSKNKAGLSPGELVYTGEVKDQQVHVTILDYNENTLTEKCQLDLEEIKSYDRFDTTTWIDFDGIHLVELMDKVR